MLEFVINSILALCCTLSAGMMKFYILVSLFKGLRTAKMLQDRRPPKQMHSTRTPDSARMNKFNNAKI